MQLIQFFNYDISGPSKILEEKGVRKQIFEGRYKFKLSPQQASQITLACDQRVEAKMAFPVTKFILLVLIAVLVVTIPVVMITQSQSRIVDEGSGSGSGAVP